MSLKERPLGTEPHGLSPAQLHERFEAIWRPPPGLASLSCVNHTVIGRRFIATGFIFFLIGGIEALLIRAQLAVPENTFLGFQTYNELFTMHGTTMMFLFAVPILEGFGFYLLPKMLGARDMIFPRLSAYGYWCYLFGGLLLYSSFLVGQAPDGGWFMYVPLTGSEYTPGMRSDFWLLGITFVEISAVAAGIEIVATILKVRAPGMAIHRMPLFAWAMLVTAFMIVLGFPPLILGSILLEIERSFDLPYFIARLGGDALLWQHLFWLFGHPEVYIIFLPATGFLSMIIPTFVAHRILGYYWIVLALIATGFLSFLLWVHHMFTVGIPHLALSFFSAASMAVVIPTGIQLFAWIATLWAGRPRLEVPLLFVLGFFFIFVIGGLTGVMLAVPAFNWQVHDTHFVVAHLHYVLIGGMLFPLFAAFYYWMPGATGRLMSPALGRIAFWLIFLGFNVAFLPMHLTGMIGMTRRIYTYPPDLGWNALNLVSTIGAYVIALGVLVLIVDFFRHLRAGERVTHNPWRAGTLEWAIEAPVTNYNFISIPPVRSHDPLWEHPELPREIGHGMHYLNDPSAGRRETLGTSVLEGDPEFVIRLPHPTWVPLVAALFTAMFFVGFLTHAYLLSGVGAALALATFLYWAWHTGDPLAPDAVDAGHGRELPLHYTAWHGPGWWGLAIAILADAAMYASLLFAYFFLWAVASGWPPPRFIDPSLALPLVGLGALLLSSAAMHRAIRGLRMGDLRRMRLGLAAALLLGLGFALMQLVFFAASGVSPREHAYGAVVYTLVGFHLVHLGIALVMAAFALVRARLGRLTAHRPVDADNAALFWHYMVIQWVLGFAAVHLFPRLV
jgi:cytochrome c oxidase subunit I+III